MPVTQSIWSLDSKEQLQKSCLQSERELEDLLAAHIEILDPDWLLIGRQVKTVSGGTIDSLCMDYSGGLIVVELKKDLTPRDVTAQAIDYASCVSELELGDIAALYAAKHSDEGISLNEAYCKKYKTELNEDNLNNNIKIVIVASKMDSSTERLIRYLRNKYDIPINILFFDVFESNGQRLISRIWFEENDPSQ